MRQTIASFIKAVLWITVRSEDCHPMSTLLKPNCGINDQALRTTNAQIRVEEDNALLLRLRLLFNHGDEFMQRRRILHDNLAGRRTTW